MTEFEARVLAELVAIRGLLQVVFTQEPMDLNTYVEETCRKLLEDNSKELEV